MYIVEFLLTHYIVTESSNPILRYMKLFLRGMSSFPKDTTHSQTTISVTGIEDSNVICEICFFLNQKYARRFCRYCFMMFDNCGRLRQSHSCTS